MIHKLALGTVQFGLDYGISNKTGRIRKTEAKQIIDFAHQSGIKTIDTARAYGDSEEIIGNILTSSNVSFEIITKISALDSIRAQVEKSLSLLNCDKLEGVLFHDTDGAISNVRQIDQLIEYQKSGKVKKIGFSLYAPEQLERLFDMEREFNLVQLPYNILDQRFKNEFEELKNRNIEVHARSLFLQGIFFLNPDDLESKFDELKPKLLMLYQLVNDLNLPIAAVLLCFGLLETSIDKTVIGVESIDNLKENIDSINYIDSVEKIISELGNLECNDSKMILPTNWG